MKLKCRRCGLVIEDDETYSCMDYSCSVSPSFEKIDDTCGMSYRDRKMEK